MQGPYPPLPAPGTVGVDGYAMNPAFGQQPQQQFYPPPAYPPQPGNAGAYPPMPPPSAGAAQHPYPPQYADVNNNNNNNGDPSKESSYPTQVVYPMSPEDRAAETEAERYRSHMRTRDSCQGLAVLVLGILNFSLWMAFYALHIELGCECGRSDRWLLSLVPILLGPFLLGIPLYGILHAYTAFFKGRGMRSNQNRFTFGAWVWVFVCIIATGVPFAMTCGKARAADNFTQAHRQIVVHCWKNPNEDITDKYFVYYAEKQWSVQWQQRWKQKMHTITGTTEDEDANNRYNFCVAPIRYTGLGNCTYNLWSGCFKQTTYDPAASCGDAEATLCGWTYPAGAVTTQLLSNGETFYNPTDGDSELKAYESAMRLATVPSGMQQPRAAYWASDGPEGAQVKKDDAEDSIRIQRIAFYITLSGTLLCQTFFFMSQWD
eukprot:PhM_4_TR9797/c4_g1_i1/m.63028